MCLTAFTCPTSLMVQSRWGKTVKQLQALCDRRIAVWCKHPFTTLLYMQEWSSSGIRKFGFLSLTPENGKANFKWCCCYALHSWLLLRLRLIAPLKSLFLFFLFPVCGRSREHEFSGLVINTLCKGFWAFVRLQITYIIIKKQKFFYIRKTFSAIKI